jgi:hypothetical protein
MPKASKTPINESPYNSQAKKSILKKIGSTIIESNVEHYSSDDSSNSKAKQYKGATIQKLPVEASNSKLSIYSKQSKLSIVPSSSRYSRPNSSRKTSKPMIYKRKGIEMKIKVRRKKYNTEKPKEVSGKSASESKNVKFEDRTSSLPVNMNTVSSLNKKSSFFHVSRKDSSSNSPNKRVKRISSLEKSSTRVANPLKRGKYTLEQINKGSI